MSTDLQRNSTSPDTRPRNPVLAAAIVIYGTFVLLLATMPGGMVTWLQELNGNVVQQTALRVAEAVQTTSEYAGLSAPYSRLRTFFLERIREE